MFAMVGSGERRSTHKLYGFSDDVTMVRGSHQFGFGASTRYWKFDTRSTSRTGGSWTIDGSLTGLALADFLSGRVARLEIGGPSILDIHNWYLGAYVQDAWRVSDRVTLNAGVRWEPYFGQYVENDAVVIWREENFDQNIRSKVFLNAPPGLIYPGDEGFPDGKTGLNTQWWNLAPRAGRGVGRPRGWPPRRAVVGTRWAMTSWRASTTTSTLEPRRSATARSSPIRRAAWTTPGGTSPVAILTPSSPAPPWRTSHSAPLVRWIPTSIHHGRSSGT